MPGFRRKIADAVPESEASIQMFDPSMLEMLPQASFKQPKVCPIHEVGVIHTSGAPGYGS